MNTASFHDKIFQNFAREAEIPPYANSSQLTAFDKPIHGPWVHT